MSFRMKIAKWCIISHPVGYGKCYALLISDIVASVDLHFQHVRCIILNKHPLRLNVNYTHISWPRYLSHLCPFVSIPIAGRTMVLWTNCSHCCRFLIHRTVIRDNMRVLMNLLPSYFARSTESIRSTPRQYSRNNACSSLSIRITRLNSEKHWNITQRIKCTKNKSPNYNKPIDFQLPRLDQLDNSREMEILNETCVEFPEIH